MLWVATLKAVVAKVATPEERAPVPKMAVPSLKVTVPVGLDPVTVAVNMTNAAAVLGFRLDERVVVLIF